MKKILCIGLIFCFIIACHNPLNVENFNIQEARGLSSCELQYPETRIYSTATIDDDFL